MTVISIARRIAHQWESSETVSAADLDRLLEAIRRENQEARR